MSSRSDRASGSSRSRRKHSKADSYNSLPPQPESSEVFEEEGFEPPTWPPPSFLFTVKELPINAEPEEGGEAPRFNENGHWQPPLRSNGFSDPIHSRIYRWADGARISAAGECSWFEGRWYSQYGAELTEFRASTICYCNEFTRFMIATGDASFRHMDESDEPHNRWWPLTFRHEDTLSRVEEAGDHRRLAGTGAWVDALDLRAYRNRHSAGPGGLAGKLPIVIGLVALSCVIEDLDNVLLNDRAWRHRRWMGHNRGHGRTDERVLAVTTYLDPENTQGSTSGTLSALEWSSDALLR